MNIFYAWCNFLQYAIYKYWPGLWWAIYLWLDWGLVACFCFLYLVVHLLLYLYLMVIFFYTSVLVFGRRINSDFIPSWEFLSIIFFFSILRLADLALTVCIAKELLLYLDFSIICFSFEIYWGEKRNWDEKNIRGEKKYWGWKKKLGW